jgi:acyl carrier protein
MVDIATLPAYLVQGSCLSLQASRCGVPGDTSSMDRDEVIERLCEVISDVLGVGLTEINHESRFSEDLGAEPVQRHELVSVIEDALEVELHEQEALEADTVIEMADLVLDALREQAED